MTDTDNSQLSLKSKRDRAVLNRKILLERYKKPQNRGVSDPIDAKECGHNPYCGDTVNLSLALDRTQIQDVKFEGHGCVLCLVSADLMASAVKYRSIDEALSMVEQFRQTVVEQKPLPATLEQLSILQGVSQYPSRVKCVTLAWHTLKAALYSSRS